MPVMTTQDLERLLRDTVAQDASDLHLVAGHPPTLRVHGRLVEHGSEALSEDAVEAMIRGILPPDGEARLAQNRDLDFATQIDAQPGSERFRVNVFFSQGHLGACFRHIPSQIPTIEDIGFPVEVADRIQALTNGLVLVTGITGAGKTTSIAAMVQRFNTAGGYRIITIEEPVEYLFEPAPGSIVTQREVGTDVASFYDGLRYGLRQDPDILLVGEIRDRETAQLALSAAETGHIIFATLHTADAKGAMTRLIDLFPVEQHAEVRTQLSMSLRYVIAQHLLPTPQGAGRRVLALEVLFANYAVRSAIRTGKIEGIDSAIQSGRRDGMRSLDADLRRLLADGRIELAVARQFAKDPDEFASSNGL